MRKASVIFVFFLICRPALNLFAAQSPVLLFLSRQDQADTLGYNIVNELPALVYKEIIDGRVPLWDSQNKDVQITPSSLKSLEASSGDNFSQAKQLFIYELWDLDKKKGELQTVGFYFSSRTNKGEDISYGFVDYDPLDSLFRSTKIPVNSNGNCDLTFYDVLHGKYYFYNVVQIGEKKITNIKEALALKDEVTQFISQRISPPDHDVKELSYVIQYSDNPPDVAMSRSNQFIQSLQLFLNENQEVFYNLGGDKILDFRQANKIKVTSVEVVEKWRKVEDRIESELISLQIYVASQPMDLLKSGDIHFLDLLVDFKSVTDFLREKEFYFRIAKINSQEIALGKSPVYLKGLRTWKWNQLTEFVRYE